MKNVDVERRLLTAALHLPDKANALTRLMLDETDAAVAELKGVHALIIT